ncbi:uncharacterized protein LOC112467847 [Temnothorax curvispinosus]|uniref:Uncharacterized protein LOC112467847 n=1 Tax=Temnothorax curvispinosus TaxID=300111 RepID=A0A6J1RDZ6_9HYME|nr:uncharacterized protein LOC112467847 [Temnothorax curvispinosus]
MKAQVRIADRFGAFHTVRALVDQGSEASFASESLAQRLRLQRVATKVRVFGIGGEQTGVARGALNIEILPATGSSRISIHALILPRLTAYAGATEVGAKTWAHLTGLTLADSEYTSNEPIELLLGAEVFSNILQEGVRRGGPREPVAQETSLGWLISGIADTAAQTVRATVHHCASNDKLTKMVRLFWEQEELPRAAAPLTPDEQACEDLFLNAHSRSSDGRYTMRLPLRSSLPDLSGTRHNAVRSLFRMEARFQRDVDLQQQYVQFIREYESLQHMTSVANHQDAPRRVCYVPHHGVLKAASTTTKLRVVFNGSSSLPSGESLNDHLLVGLNLLPALADILLRWRWHLYVFVTDIVKMYRQIVVHPDCDLQRIVWRYDPQMTIVEFILLTVTYGLACAPFLAIRTLKQLAKDERARYLIGAETLEDDTFVDDVTSGASTLTKALKKRDELISICKAGGFPLKKWAANDAALLKGIQPEDRLQDAQRPWHVQDSQSLLGVLWNPSRDDFSFSIKAKEMTQVTKRTVLSLTVQLFDPLGWLAPVVIRAKLFIQTAWMQGLDWDTPMLAEDADRWRDFHKELPVLENVRIPRWMKHGPPGSLLELHGFADASKRAYAAVLYLRAETENGIVTTLVCAKTKVAPLKKISLARLELCAADLLTRLTEHTLTVFQFTIPAHLWSDSEVVLAWIRSHPALWKTFVANRVTSI